MIAADYQRRGAAVIARQRRRSRWARAVTCLPLAAEHALYLIAAAAFGVVAYVSWAV